MMSVIPPYVRLLLLVVALTAALFAPVRAQDDDDPARAIIAEINALRVAQGYPPLRSNATLQAMARAQAEYIASLPDIPEGGAIHIDANGDDPRHRALEAPYHWVPFGSDERIVLGENGGVGSVDFMMNFWKQSPTHSRTMLNENYREIGVWTEPHEFGYLTIVVFGAQPNDLPLLYNPVTQVLYLTNETNPHGSEQWIRDVATIRVFDRDGNPLTGALPWTPTLSNAAQYGDSFFVLLDDGSIQLIRAVDLRRDIAILPETLAWTPDTAPVAAAPTPTPMSLPPAAQPTSPPTPTQPVMPAAQPTSPPTPTPPVMTSPGLRVIYNDRSLTLLNNADSALDLYDLTLVSPTYTLRVERWAQFSNVRNVIPGACLQVWGFQETTDVPLAPGCDYVASVITIAPEQRFWRDGDFTVNRGDLELAACSAAAGMCEVDMSR